MGPIAALLVPHNARGHWDREAFARLRRRATWLAAPLAVLAGLVVILLLALLDAGSMDDVLGALIWAVVTIAVFLVLRRAFEHSATRALRTTVHLHPVAHDPEPDGAGPPPPVPPAP